MTPERLLIHGGLVADPATGVVEPLDLLVEAGRLCRIGAPGSIEAPGVDRHDATDRLILPGFVNAHTHSHANLMKGVADRWTLEASLVNAPWLGGGRDPEAMYVSALLGAADMASKGCTACFDLVYEFPRPTAEGFAAVARAYADVGIRAVLAPMIADKGLLQAIPGLWDALPADLRTAAGQAGPADGDETLAAVEAIVESRHGLPPHVELALAPTIPHHCSDRFLTACLDLANRHALPVHMHVAESRLQVVAAHRLWGISPVAHLDRLGALRPGFTAAHAVWLDEEDLDLLAARGCAVAHVPASNLRLGSGIADVRAMLQRGITVGLATDGANSSDALSMVQAVRLASYGARAYAGPREHWLGASESLGLATHGGADLLKLQAAGRIAVGALADLVFFDLTHLDFCPLNDPLNQVVTCADSGAVADVMVGGRFIVLNGELRSVDPAELRERVAAAMVRLRPRIADARALSARIEPHVVAFAERMMRGPLEIERLLQRQTSIGERQGDAG